MERKNFLQCLMLGGGTLLLPAALAEGREVVKQLHPDNPGPYLRLMLETLKKRTDLEPARKKQVEFLTRMVDDLEAWFDAGLLEDEEKEKLHLFQIQWKMGEDRLIVDPTEIARKIRSGKEKCLTLAQVNTMILRTNIRIKENKSGLSKTEWFWELDADRVIYQLLYYKL